MSEIASNLPKVQFGRPGKHQQERLTPKLKAALDAMIWRGLDYAAAGREAGLTTRNMRLALNRALVKAYLDKGQDELLERERLRSVHRLATIRDKNNNMAAVASAKAILVYERGVTHGVQTQPGVVINIIPDHETTIQTKTIQHQPVAISEGHGEDPE